MTTHTLSFGTITLLQKDIAEVIVNDGVEMNLEMVETYHQFLLENMPESFSLLINKKNAYTYSFEAQLQLATLTQINSMAVLVYSNISAAATKNLATMPRAIPWKLEVFNDRKNAIKWLQKKQNYTN
ncbi:hypothetical protein MNBD_GAMMA08-1399 [hydrothermal vent metagenome]|uniref:STAS/SEC14 domain-containing protein n=1 Tax=hydrothermal vent metagenome TaxID=652676 RepID=A0A3B0XA76_9ZZZZ